MRWLYLTILTVAIVLLSTTPLHVSMGIGPISYRPALKAMILDYTEQVSGKRDEPLADAILDAARGDINMVFCMVAIAHQETHFKPRRGRKGERGYFQVMPWVAHSLYPHLTLKQTTQLLENDVKFQAETVRRILVQHYERFTSWGPTLFAYNHCHKYVQSVLLKKKILDKHFKTWYTGEYHG